MIIFRDIDGKFDTKALEVVLSNAICNVGSKTMTEATCDRGYRGTKEVILNANSITLSTPDITRKKRQMKISY
jgi:hypothetical protein